MNSCYWGETLVKLLNLTNSVHNFNNNGSETEKVASKLPTEEARHVNRWSCDHAKPYKARDSRHVGTWSGERASHVDTRVDKHARHVDLWGSKHSRHVGTWARETQITLALEHVSTQGLLARERVFSMQDTQFSRFTNLSRIKNLVIFIYLFSLAICYTNSEP